MAIGPIGNAIFVNQMTPAATALQNAHNNRIEFQNMVAQAAISEREEKVLEVRPAEENQEIDPEREHQRDEADRENERSKKRANEDEEKDEPAQMPIHKLDITV